MQTKQTDPDGTKCNLFVCCSPRSSTHDSQAHKPKFLEHRIQSSLVFEYAPPHSGQNESSLTPAFFFRLVCFFFGATAVDLDFEDWVKGKIFLAALGFTAALSASMTLLTGVLKRPKFSSSARWF